MKLSMNPPCKTVRNLFRQPGFLMEGGLGFSHSQLIPPKHMKEFGSD